MKREREEESRAVVIEPFCGGSHAQLVKLLLKEFGKERLDVFTLPDRKWHWRVLLSAAIFAREKIPPLKPNTNVLFVTSMINLAELIAMRPDLAKLKKVFYFHENQLAYPSRSKGSFLLFCSSHTKHALTHAQEQIPKVREILDSDGTK